MNNNLISLNLVLSITWLIVKLFLECSTTKHKQDQSAKANSTSKCFKKN